MSDESEGGCHRRPLGCQRESRWRAKAQPLRAHRRRAEHLQPHRPRTGTVERNNRRGITTSPIILRNPSSVSDSWPPLLHPPSLGKQFTDAPQGRVSKNPHESREDGILYKQCSYDTSDVLMACQISCLSVYSYIKPQLDSLEVVQ